MENHQRAAEFALLHFTALTVVKNANEFHFEQMGERYSREGYKSAWLAYDGEEELCSVDVFLGKDGQVTVTGW